MFYWQGARYSFHQLQRIDVFWKIDVRQEVDLFILLNFSSLGDLV